MSRLLDPMSRAEHVAEYILSQVRQRAPHSWRQAARSPSLGEMAVGSSLRAFADHRIKGVSELSVRGLFLIANGFPVVVSSHPFSAQEVLTLQARGERCLSLLPSGCRAPDPHGDSLAFVLHDLCHLAKFADPAHFDEQVGFFRSLERAFAQHTWCGVEEQLDAQWRTDRAHVSADMNGSCVFLFVVLKAKLKMAALRRRVRASRNAPQHGQPAFPEPFETLLDALCLDGRVRDAARAICKRSDDAAAAEILVEHFRGLRPSPDPGRRPAHQRGSLFGETR